MPASRRSSARYCSRECNRNHWWAKNPKYKANWKKDNQESVKASERKSENKRRKRALSRKAVPCLVCNKPVVTTKLNEVAKFPAPSGDLCHNHQTSFGLFVGKNGLANVFTKEKETIFNLWLCNSLFHKKERENSIAKKIVIENLLRANSKR
jgi:hypothetical protein